MLKTIIKEKILKEEIDNMLKGASTLTEKMIHLEARMINIEKDNVELKQALGNLSVAYLEMIRTLPQSTPPHYSDPSVDDDYLESVLSSFISSQSDDDLPN